MSIDRVHGSVGWRTPDRVSCSILQMPVATSSPLGPAELYPRMSRFVRRALGGLGVRAPDVEDLTHEVFVTLHRKGCTFHTERAARAWLFAAARRVASNERRARTRADARAPGWAASEPPAPDVALAHREAATRVERFAAALPWPASAIFVRSEVAGQPAPEIASELGINLDTTYSHIRRVRRSFARTLAIVLGLLLLLAAMMRVGCAAGASDDGERVALRGPADLAR